MPVSMSMEVKVLDFRQVSGEELGHAKSADTIGTEDLGHFLVGDEELLVLGVLQIVFLQVSPQLLDAFGAAGLLLANNVGQFGAELHGFGKSTSFGHLGKILWNNLIFEELCLYATPSVRRLI